MSRSSPGDVVLRWASEAGRGSWPRFSEIVATAGERAGMSAPPWLLATSLMNLGHVELDWVSREWSAAPPCLAVARGMGVCGYLSGWRTAPLLARFDEVAVEVDLFSFDVSQPEPAAPTAIFVKASSIDRLVDVAEQLHLKIVFDPSSQLVDLVELPHMDELDLGAGPPVSEPVHRFDDAHMTWILIDEPTEPGLYRFELQGRKTFRLLDHSHAWRIADRAVGQMHVLRGREDVLAWHSQSADALAPRAMSIPGAVSLPPLAERAAVAASGLLPRKLGDRLVYLNVSREVAAILAERLGLVLSHRDEIDLED